MVDKSSFQTLLAPVFDFIKDQPLDDTLERSLNERFPWSGPYVESLLEACRIGHEGGWVCERQNGGIRYGRVIKPSDQTFGFSVDVVDMNAMAGPHHLHPNGEIDLIMPTEGPATFDRHPAGWLVYGPGTAHEPTVEGGRAYVLYLLPAGAIQFTAA